MLKVSRTAADAETEKEPELVVHVDEFLFAADMPMLMSMMMGMMMMMGPLLAADDGCDESWQWRPRWERESEFLGQS